jgi:hypothetical protein
MLRDEQIIKEEQVNQWRVIHLKRDEILTYATTEIDA